jgi:hypothetical protein
MDVAIALLSIVLCWLSLTEAQKAAENAKMPLATIHIGPHKMATTTIQRLLTSANSITSMRGQITYWPDLNGTILKQWEIVQFSTDFRDQSNKQFKSVARMGRFFKESRRLGHNVIVSTKDFVHLDLQKILKLRDMLQDFDVYIIAV